MTILIATTNPGKFKEIAEILEPLDRELISLKDMGISHDFEETEDSFEGNALGKARFYSELAGLPTVADDSGIFVEALADELGVKTRRWGAGAEASDEEWLEHFMWRMAQEDNRRACFVAAAAFVDADVVHVELGEVLGLITQEIEAPLKPGIPLSSVFRPDGYDKVYTALLAEGKKHEISHRGQAFEKLLKYLKHA